LGTTCVGQDYHIHHTAAKNFNVVIQLCKRTAQVGDVIDKHVPCIGKHGTFKLCPSRHALHGVCSSVIDPVRLHDASIHPTLKQGCTYCRQSLRYCIVTRGFLCMWRHIDEPRGKTIAVLMQPSNCHIQHQLQRRMLVACLGELIGRMRLEHAVLPEQGQWRDAWCKPLVANHSC